MNETQVITTSFSKLRSWEKLAHKRVPLSFDFEITARCNNNCRHCYINLPAGDKKVIEAELSFNQIKEIVDQAVALGALWCLLTGGEPLLRKDFADIFLYLKKKGLLISVFTNATLLNQEHIRLFKRYPPRDIEVSVYGITKAIYEQVTRTPGSFAVFLKGLNLLLDAGINVRLKAMALRSNFSELKKIFHFCRQQNKNHFRFDPFLHLRYDGDQSRNKEIVSERLLPEEIADLEYSDPERLLSIEKECGSLTTPELSVTAPASLFNCGAGHNSFSISYDGRFRLCPSLCALNCSYDLKKGGLKDAWNNFVPRVRRLESDNSEFLNKCRACPIINLCFWCPAHAHLEAGKLDQPIDYFCETAQARAALLKK